MSFDTIGDNLIVMNSFYGIFQVDLKTGKTNQLVSEKDVIGDDVRIYFAFLLSNPSNVCFFLNSSHVHANSSIQWQWREMAIYFSHIHRQIMT